MKSIVCKAFGSIKSVEEYELFNSLDMKEIENLNQQIQQLNQSITKRTELINHMKEHDKPVQKDLRVQIRRVGRS